jgi:nitroreductase
MMTELYDALQRLCERRRSVRRFAEAGVPEGAVQQILAIARLSPYASGRTNWEVLTVADRQAIQAMSAAVRRRSDDLGRELRRDPENGFAAYAPHFSAFDTAPLLLVPVYRIATTLSYLMEEIDPEIQQWERDNYVKSIACVGAFILLAAESLGLGACFMTGPLLAEPSLRRILRVKPGRDIGAVIPIGYPLLES